VEAWERSSAELLERSRTALDPTVRTLRASAFLFGQEPSLADAALWGQVAMVRFAGIPPSALGDSLPGWVSRLEAVMAGRRRGSGAPSNLEPAP
jgi:glutathione S-transferase